MEFVFSSHYAGNLMYYRSILKVNNYCIDLFENLISNLSETDV